jgi:rhodanese-related sulfurtransferase
MGPGSINQLFVDEVFEIYNKKDPGYVFLDVRQPQEWEDGVIPGSVKISLGELEDHLDELDKSKKYIMVCRSGARSNRASNILLENGFTDVSNFQGGMMAWEDEENPVET